MKIYTIEHSLRKSMCGILVYYRFVSLYNGAVGGWSIFKDVAVSEGKRHQKIIEKIKPELKEKF